MRMHSLNDAACVNNTYHELINGTEFRYSAYKVFQNRHYTRNSLSND